MVIDQGNAIELTPVEFALKVGLVFENTGLLFRALTHRSYVNENPEVVEDNERLEFLGDAILDFLVGAWLYNRFPEMAEGKLTRMRAALVGNLQLAEFARQIGIGSAVRVGKGESESGGRERSTLLGSSFEALIGAIYLDQGMQVVQQFTEPLLETAINKILHERKDQDPKSLLQEWAQAQGYGPPSYRTVSIYGPDHDRIFEIQVEIKDKVYGVGKGHSKQEAAKAAAKLTLIEIGLE